MKKTKRKSKLTFAEKFSNYQMMSPIVAHRGASGTVPENTLAAFTRAKELGAQWIETDVQITGDGGLVVHHDYSLGRTVPGSGFLTDYTTSQLEIQDAGSWFSQDFSKERIPTLGNLFNHCSNLGLGINLEVKCRNKKLVSTTVNALATFLHDYPEKISLEISSFNFEVLYHLSRKIPGIRLGLLIGGMGPEIAATGYWEPILKEINGYALHLGKDQVTPSLVQRVHDEGYLIFVYTINTFEEAKKMRDWGVDFICTDFPDRIMI